MTLFGFCYYFAYFIIYNHRPVIKLNEKETPMTEEEKIRRGFELLAHDENEKKIYGALKSFHITPFNINYDDFVQEGRLAFVNAYCQFVDKPSQDHDNFDLYAYKRIKWRITDLLKRQNAQNAHADFSLDNELISHEVIDEILIDPRSAEDVGTQILKDDFFQRLYKACTQQEQFYLIGAIVKGMNGSEIAEYYSVTRQAVSKWKKGALQKAELLSKLD